MTVVRLMVVTMPPLWFLRYAFFLQSVKNSRVQTKQANRNLQSYVDECWNLKDRKQFDLMQFESIAINRTVSSIAIDPNECSGMESDWCRRGICWMKEMPEEMLEQIVVLSTICFRW